MIYKYNFMGLLPFPSTYEQYYSKAEAWGCCSPLYFDVHVVAVVIDQFVGVGVAFTLSHTAVTCWVCSPSPVLQSNSRVQQKLGVVALPYTSMFTLSNTAVTCWVCFPSHSTYEYQQSTAEAWGSCSPLYINIHFVVVVGVGVGVGFTISPTAVTCWVCFPSNSTCVYQQSTAEAWGSCSPLYFNVYTI